MEVRPGYKQTEVGIIPEEWDVTPIECAFDVDNNLRLPISHTIRKRMVGQYPYYGPTGVQGWVNEYRVEGEYALIGEDGDHFLKWQSQPMTLLVHGKFNVNNHAHLVRGTKNLTEWFYWFFSHRDLTPYLTRQGAGRYKLTKAALLKIPCALPPPSEQRAIATALSDVDSLLGVLDRLIAKKRDLKQAAMQQLLTGKTRLPRFSGEWEVVEFGDIAVIRNAKVIASSMPAGTQCVELEHIDQGTGRLLMSAEATGLGSKYSFSKGDVLFGRLRAYLRKYWLAEFDGVCSTEIWPLVARDERLSGNYLHLLVQTNDFVNSAGISYGTHMPRSDWSVLKKFQVRLPSMPEQTAIAAVLSDMDTEIEALEARRTKTRDLKQAMMQELLTGKTRLV